MSIESGESAEQENPIDGERFHAIHFLLEKNGISKEEIISYLENYDMGMSFIKARKAEVEEFKEARKETVEELKKKAESMNDEELEQKVKEDFKKADPGEPVRNNPFLIEFNKRGGFGKKKK